MDVFVYGTLADPDTAGSVLDSFAYRGRATLVGLRRVAGRYPTLAPGGETTGRILATDDLPALDRYEGVADGLYVRVSVPLAGGPSDDPAGEGSVDTYVGDPDRLGAPASWPGDGPLPERVRSYLRDHDVYVVRDG